MLKQPGWLRRLKEVHQSSDDREYDLSNAGYPGPADHCWNSSLPWLQQTNVGHYSDSRHSL